MAEQKEKLHYIHIAILIYMIQSGVIIFTLPRNLAYHFGTNSWILVIAFSIIASLNIGLIALVYRMVKGRSIFTIIEATLPKVIWILLYLFFTCLWGLLASMVDKQYIMIVQMISFPTTPSYLFKILTAFATFLFVIKGIYNISKGLTIVFFASVWMVFLFVYNIAEIELDRYTPFFFQWAHEQGNLWEGFLNTYPAFLGYELCLLLFPYVARKNFIKSVLFGNQITTFIYITTSIVCFGFYSFYQLQHLSYPLLSLFSYIQFPFIVRLENLIMSIFIMKVLGTTVLFYWASVEMARRILPSVKVTYLSAFIIATTFFISLIPTLQREVTSWLKLLSYFQIGVAFFFPIVLLILAQIYKGKEKDVDV